MLNKNTKNVRPVRFFFLLIALSSAITGCSSSNNGSSDSSASTSLTDYDFSLSAHENNVLMVKVDIKSKQEVEAFITFESAETGVQTTAKNNASTEHSITVVGLRPETQYQFTSVMTTQSGEVITSTPQSYTTPSLPFDLPNIELKSNTENSYSGVTFFSITGPNARFIGLDNAGQPIWYLHNNDVPMLSGSPTIKSLGEGKLMLLLNREVWVINIEGEILSSYELPSYHHEATILRNGNVAVLVNEYAEFNGNLLKGDRIQEYSTSGQLVWEWSSFEHLDTSRLPGELSTRIVNDGAFDWSHSNSIYEQQDDGSLLLSVRSQSWVVNIDRNSGNINWILGSAEGIVKEGLSEKFFNLQTGSWMSAQHAPMKTQNGDYLIYDNRNESELSGSLHNSRAVKYQIDTSTMHANQVWEFVVDKYTQSLGDVDELPNGNILITAGGPGGHENAYLVEAAAIQSLQPVWELHVNNDNIYRAERVSLESLQPQDNNSTEGLTLSGDITGLHADGLTLFDGNETLFIPAGSTRFSFTETVNIGATYHVQLIDTPENHDCNIINGNGTIAVNISLIEVVCNDSEVNTDLTRLPIGDPLILQRALGDSAPEVGKLWLCRLPVDGAGAAPSDDWTNDDGSWNYILKPQVEGENYYTSEFSVTLDGMGNRIISGNNLPTTATGTFPVEQGTTAYLYDRNPNSISPHNVQITFDANPTVNAEPSCIGFGANGISLTGAAIYQGSSTVGTDASAFEMLDSSGGHTDGTETYHYHYLSDNLLSELDPDTGGHSKLTGYIQDGFGIFGPRGEDGNVLSSADLDECHGHTHDIEWDGEIVNMYHYHWTYDFPYNVGCLRGTPQDLNINQS